MLFRNTVKSEADRNGMVNLMHGIGIQPAYVFFQPCPVYGPYLLQQDHGIVMQSLQLIS